MRCPWCGADCPTGAIACYNCGIIWSEENGPKPSPDELRRQSQPQHRPPVQQDVTSQSNLYRKKQPNYVMIAGIGVVIILLSVLVSVALNASSSDQTGDRIAGPLEGTWETSSVTIFNMKTD